MFLQSTHFNKHVTDWKGITKHDAYRPNTQFYICHEARKKFFGVVYKKMQRIGELAQGDNYKLEAKPEIGFFFVEEMPLPLSCQANIGLSQYLLAKSLLKNCLSTLYKNEMEAMKEAPLKQKLTRILVGQIDIILLLKGLERHPEILQDLEDYKAISASQVDIRRIVSVEKLVQIGLLYSDFIPWDKMELLAEKREILEIVVSHKQEYGKYFDGTKNPWDKYEMGFEWAKACASALNFGERREVTVGTDGDGNPQVCQTGKKFLEQGGWAGKGDFEIEPDQDLPILGIDEAEALEMAKKILNPSDLIDIFTATKQACQQDDISDKSAPDLLPFEKTHMQGEFLDYKSVRTHILGQEVDGSVEESLIGPSYDFEGVEKLINKSQPITKIFSDMIFANIKNKRAKMRSSNGTEIISEQLPLFQVTDSLFSKSIKREEPSPGDPVVVILQDASGSMVGNRIELSKILVAGMAGAIQNSRIVLQSGVYGNNTHPVVQYTYHEKFMGKSVREVSARIHNIRNFGGQDDALAIYFMLSEAAKLYPRNTCFFILLSDQHFLKSFNLGIPATDEVREVLKKCAKMWNGLHTTIVSIGNPSSVLSDLADKIIYLSEKDLNNIALVTQKIGTYISECITDYYQKKLIRKK